MSMPAARPYRAEQPEVVAGAAAETIKKVVAGVATETVHLLSYPFARFTTLHIIPYLGILVNSIACSVLCCGKRSLPRFLGLCYNLFSSSGVIPVPVATSGSGTGRSWTTNPGSLKQSKLA